MNFCLNYKMSDSVLRKRNNIANAMDNISLNDEVFYEDMVSEETVSSNNTEGSVSSNDTEDFIALRNQVEELEEQLRSYKMQTYGLSGLLCYLLLLYTTVTVGFIF